MSLIRQIWLLLLGTVLLAFAGGVTVAVDSARDTLQTQLRLKNSDNAAALALALSQQKGDAQLMALLMAAQFDTGFYRRIRFTGAEGKVMFQRESDVATQHAPPWFATLLPLQSVPGLAQVSDGWRALGSVEVVSHSAYAHDELWRGSLRSAAALALVGLLAGLAGTIAVGRIRRPLARAVEQARSLERGEYVTLDEPAVPELRRLTRAMNSMVARLKLVFEGQAAQVETLRRQANCDPLTGLSHRSHFLVQLGAMLQREDGAAEGGLVLLRVLDLAEVNRTLGHAATDRLLGAIAQALQPYTQRGEGCFIGRLNGSDFALGLPVGGVVKETAEALTEALRVVLRAFGGQVAVATGAVEMRRGSAVARVMGEADLALARAETRGAFAVEVVSDIGSEVAALGESAWRQRIHAALDEGRVHLASYPLRGAGDRLIHLECPLRLQLDPDGPFVVAAQWLPLAVRSRLTALIDERAVVLALAEVAVDGQPRCVNIAPASLADSSFASRLRAVLTRSPREARQLWIEVSEAAAAEQFDRVRELGRQLRPTGARLGLEHAGERLSRIDRLIEAELDYVKLDTTITQGVGTDAHRAGFVAGLATLLHSLSLQVFAEGVSCEEDMQALWGCGVDGVTGPWID